MSDISPTRRLGTTRPLSRPSTIFLVSSRDPAIAAPDQAGVHGDGVRTARPILASRARARVQAISRSADVRLVRRPVPLGALAAMCAPASHSAIVYLAFGTDAAGGAYADDRVFAELRAAANAPYFWVQSVYLGAGIVGGSMISIEDLSSRYGRRGRSSLERRAAESINYPQQPGSTDVRLARAPKVGHPREPVAVRQHRALSRSEPVGGIQEHGAERHGRAGSFNRS